MSATRPAASASAESLKNCDPSGIRKCQRRCHERELSVRGGRNVTGQPSPADLVRANVRRLDRLERYGLVARLPAGKWRVRAVLVSQLEARESSHPRHRIDVERLGPKRELGRNEPDRGPSRGRGPGLSR